MAKRAACWKLEDFPIKNLQPHTQDALGARVKEDRRVYKCKNAPDATGMPEEPQWVYLPNAKPPDAAWLVGVWTMGAMIPFQDWKAANAQNKKANFKTYRNPITGVLYTSRKDPIIVGPQDMIGADAKGLAIRLEAVAKTEPDARKKEQIRKSRFVQLRKVKQLPPLFVIAIDTLDPSNDLFVGLDSANCSVFGYKANEVQIPLPTMETLIADPEDFFFGEAAKTTIAGRNAQGNAILLDLSSVANFQQYTDNSAIWIKIFKVSTGAGSYKPPRSINPRITLYLEHKSKDISFKDFKALVKAVGDAGSSATPPILQSWQIFTKQKGSKAGAGYFWLGSSPSGDYNTWVNVGAISDYLVQRKERSLPTDAKIKAVDQMLAETTVNQSKTDRLVALRNVVYGNSTKNPVTNRALKTDHGQDNYAVICNIVSAASLKTAVEDPRTKYPSQKDVWGGISASEIANEFSWNDNRPSNGWPRPKLQAAEWLHRSAYSWGGIVAGQAGTSQVPENLIFGTSETNSIMTRYETIWQELMRTVGAVDKKAYGKLRSVNNMKCNVEEISRKGNTVGRISTPVEKARNKWQPWLSYQLDYSLQLQTTSRNFDWAQYLEVDFWPFQRMFFTSFESALDKSIMNFLGARAMGSSISAGQAVQIVGPGEEVPQD